MVELLPDPVLGSTDLFTTWVGAAVVVVGAAITKLRLAPYRVPPALAATSL
jgi:hypothetical protein